MSNSKVAACPTDVVDAPIELVWRMLTDMAGWGTFFDLRVSTVEPPGPAVVGQRLLGESGPRWLHLGVSFVFTEIDPERHRLLMDVKLPLGLIVREDLDCIPIDEGHCRVNYHCNFELPGGLRGAVVRALLGRELQEGPVESLSRLKRVAEQRHLCARNSATTTDRTPLQ